MQKSLTSAKPPTWTKKLIKLFHDMTQKTKNSTASSKQQKHQLPGQKMETSAGSTIMQNADLPVSNNSNSQLLDRKPLKNTPFELVGNQETGYFIALGRFRITEPAPTKEEAKLKLSEERWNIITQMITTLTDAMIKINNENKTQNK